MNIQIEFIYFKDKKELNEDKWFKCQAVFLAANAALFLASIAALVLIMNIAMRDIPSTVAKAGS